MIRQGELRTDHASRGCTPHASRITPHAAREHKRKQRSPPPGDIIIITEKVDVNQDGLLV